MARAARTGAEETGRVAATRMLWRLRFLLLSLCVWVGV
jgi:hypothetical protein